MWTFFLIFIKIIRLKRNKILAYIPFFVLNSIHLFIDGYTYSHW